MNAQGLKLQLRTLKLPSFVEHHEEIAERAGREGLSFSECLRQLVELELSDREVRKIERLRKRSGSKRPPKTDPLGHLKLTHSERVDSVVRGGEGGRVAPLLGEPREACPQQALA